MIRETGRQHSNRLKIKPKVKRRRRREDLRMSFRSRKYQKR